MIEFIANIFKLVLLWFSTKTEKDSIAKKQKEQILKEAADAIKDGDTSAVTALFDKLRK